MNIIIFVFVAVIIVSVPSSSTACHIRYDIYTRTSQNYNVDLEATNINTILTDRLTAVIVHGHGGTGSTTLNPYVKDAFLWREDMNVIVVDWSQYARESYSVASGAVPTVGTCLADSLRPLLTVPANASADTNPLLSHDLLHLVGFDLGAHVVGFTGRMLERRVARITGLSPARRYWGSRGDRLNNGDAVYVEIIHTDSNGAFGNGVNEVIGQVDIFVNGGSGQPGCFLNNRCNHNFAWEIFERSIRRPVFGNRCNNRLQVTLNTCRGGTYQMGDITLNNRGNGIYRVNV